MILVFGIVFMVLLFGFMGLCWAIGIYGLVDVMLEAERQRKNELDKQ